MTTVALIYAALFVGFALGYVTCGLLSTNRRTREHTRAMSRSDEAREVLDRG